MDEADYVCECPSGYEFKDGSCKNIDECDEDEDICNNGECTDYDGGYYCTCDDGWDGKNCDVSS